MMPQDWLTLGLASLVIAFAVFAEIRDCHAMREILARYQSDEEVSRGWRFAIRGLNCGAVLHNASKYNFVGRGACTARRWGGKRCVPKHHCGSTLFARGR